MPKGIYAAASAMRADSRAVDVISHNIANAQSPGFRRVVALRESFSETLENKGRDGSIQKDGGAGVFQEGVYRNFDKGQIRETGNPFDMALNGSGFLVVQGDDGNYLSRSGHFTRDTNGQMVTPDGWPLMGQGGPIRLPATANGVEIDKSGRLYAMVPTDAGVERAFIDQVRVVDVADENLQKMYAVNGQYFSIDQRLTQDASGTEILQGRLENANVDSIKELVEMVAVQRRYEAAQKALTTQINMEGNYSEVLRGS